MDIFWFRGWREYDIPDFVPTSTLPRHTIITERLILLTPPALVGRVILRDTNVIVITLCKSSVARYVHYILYVYFINFILRHDELLRTVINIAFQLSI